MGTIGAGAAVSGMGTAALFSDNEEMNDNVMTAGRLDLEVGWGLYYDDDHVETQPLTSDPPAIFEIPPHGDAKPCDHGEASITLHVYDNPAWIYMGSELTSGAGTDLVDEMVARVWYDLDGDNVYDEGSEPLITSGTLRDVLDDLETGILLDANPLEDGSDNGECIRLGKYDATPKRGATYGPGDGEEDDDFSAGTIEITDVYEEDGEVVGIEWESDLSICNVRVAGGSETVNHPYDCEIDGWAFAPEREHRRRNWYEISNVTFYYCPGKETDDAECFQNSNDYHIGFEWELPCSVGNEVQNESVEFDLLFHAQQCRHNGNPDNPYA